MKKVSIVVPVYQNEPSIALTFEAIRKTFAEKLPHLAYEVVFINDGSRDGSLAEIKKLKARYEAVKLISFSRNFGQNAAMIAGNRHAQGDCVINISCDLQDPVELMPEMVGKWEGGAKIVICERSGREDPWSQKVFSNTLYKILRISVPYYPKQGFDYYLMDRRVLDIINPYHGRNTFLAYDVLETGFKPQFIPYFRRQRAFGKSSYKFAIRIKHGLDTIINSSYLPIRFASAFGLLTAFAGFCYALAVIHGRLVNNIQVPGYAPVIVLILFFSGINLLFLGLIGEYLWRTYDQGKKRPEYVVDELDFGAGVGQNRGPGEHA